MVIFTYMQGGKKQIFRGNTKLRVSISDQILVLRQNSSMEMRVCAFNMEFLIRLCILQQGGGVSSLCISQGFM